MIFRQALQKFGANAKKKLQEAVPVATGKTRRSIRYRTTPESVTVYQDGNWFDALIYGRPPRKNAGDTGFAAELLKWMVAVGGVDGIPTTEAGAGRLAWFINKHGTRLHQGKATSALEGFNFDKEITELERVLGKELADSVHLNLIKTSKK